MMGTIALIMALNVANPMTGVSSKDLADINGQSYKCSEIKSDEQVIFFRTAASLNRKNTHWIIPIHGWIYEPEDSLVRIAAIEALLEKRYGLVKSEANKRLFEDRINHFLGDNERGKSIVINIAGNTYQLPTSKSNGHFFAELLISDQIIQQYIAKNYNQQSLRFTTVTDPDDSRTFAGEVLLIGKKGISVISDIDDTIKISNVRQTKELINHTFYLPFEKVPGMAETYSRWGRQGVHFHFVSSSPWQLYDPLNEFLDQSGFPHSTLSLKMVRFKDSSILNLFKNGSETKPPLIKSILDQYPSRKFILIGDSGEQDPEVYVQLLRERPDQILKVYIRNVTNEQISNNRFSRLLSEVGPDKLELFVDSSSLKLPNL